MINTSDYRKRSICLTPLPFLKYILVMVEAPLRRR